MNPTKKIIGVVGLGYVGLPLAIEFGKYRSVIGFDINCKRISELTEYNDKTLECTREQLIAAKGVKYTSKSTDLKACSIFIVTVPTPVDSANRPDMRPLIGACEVVGMVLKYNDIVIFESTVFPGATEEVCVPILEATSGLRFNKDFYCGYSPERIVPGDKTNTLTKIRKITSGSTPKVADEIDELYSEIVEAGTWKASCIKVAEAAKVIENCQRDLNIAFVNELSLIFAKIGIDTKEVLDAAGTKWNFLKFWPGLVGGHCIGVDPYYLTHKAEQLGYHPRVILAGRNINDNMAFAAAHSIIKLMIKNGIDVSSSTVAVYGVTFKDNCPDIRNSKVFDLIYELKSWGINVIAIDPWADSRETEEVYGIKLSEMSEPMLVDSLVFAVGHEEFKGLELTQLRKSCKANKPVLGDLKLIFERSKASEAGFTVFRL